MGMSNTKGTKVEEEEEITKQVKTVLFDYIRNSVTLPGLVSSKRFDLIIQDIMSSCAEDVVKRIGLTGQVLGTLATGILHYGLTCTTMRSQRRTEYCGVEVDIVMPDLRTLKADPKRALLICIMDTIDPDAVQKRIAEIDGIQPVVENIWIVLPHVREGPDLGGRLHDALTYRRSFVICADDPKRNTFAGILPEIGRFVNSNDSSKLRILGI